MGSKDDEAPLTGRDARKGSLGLALMGLVALALAAVAGEFGDRTPLLAAWVGSIPAGILAGRHQGRAVQRGTLKPVTGAGLGPLVMGVCYFLYVVLGDGFALAGMSVLGGVAFGMGLVFGHYANTRRQ